MNDELTWAPAWRISELIQVREVSPVEVLEHFLGRIEEHDPVLQAFDHLDEERARQEATAAEAAVLDGDDLGPLHGIPTAVKGHIDIAGVAETMPFGMGVARRDHPVVERLRGAGAIVIGHTTMPIMREDGSFDHEATARNPWDPARTPGISSAGTAAAIAAGLLPVALGSDGGGSSCIPAAYSGYLGVHPTAGLVPWVDPKGQTSSDTSTIGPATRDVRDAATMLSVIAGPDGRDQGGLQVDLPDPRSELARGAEGMRLAWTDDFGFALQHGVEESSRVITYIRGAAFALSGIGAEEEWDAAAGVRQRAWERFARLFQEHDLLLSPTIHSVAPTVGAFANQIPDGLSILKVTPGAASFAVYTAQFNWLRFPAVSVPCGFVDGLPVGLQIIGPPASEARIFRLAEAILAAFPQDARPPVS